MIRDPLVPEASDPYEKLASVGISPRSTAREVRDAAFDLMAHGLMTIDARLAWDELRFVERRLVVDFFRYPVDWPEAIARLRATPADVTRLAPLTAEGTGDSAEVVSPDLLPLLEAHLRPCSGPGEPSR